MKLTDLRGVLGLNIALKRRVGVRRKRGDGRKGYSKLDKAVCNKFLHEHSQLRLRNLSLQRLQWT